MIKCEYCGGVCEDDFELQVFHRSCRFKAAFPTTYKTEGGIVSFDVSAIRDQLAEKGILDDESEKGDEPCES